MSTNSSSQFVVGFNEWKHGGEQISAHENSAGHRDAIIALRMRKSMGATVDAALVKVTVDLHGVFWWKQYSALCINGKYINLYHWRAYITGYTSVLKYVWFN